MNKLYFGLTLLLTAVAIDTFWFNSALAAQIDSISKPSQKNGYHYIAYSFLGIILIGCLLLIWAMFKKTTSFSNENMLPIGIEAITVILIVASVVILRLADTITSEGTVGILGSIVGYVLGKQISKKKPINEKEDTDQAFKTPS